MTVKQRLTRSYIYMFLVPLLIAALLLILGVGIALFSLETKYLPRLGLTLWKMHATLEQYGCRQDLCANLFAGSG